MPFLTNPRREAFAQAYARGETAGKPAESYLAAGFKVSRKWAAASAWRLMQDAGVQRRIAEIQKDCAASPNPACAAGGEPMPILDNPRQEAFCRAFVRGATAGKRGASYLAAGYTSNPRSATNAAYRLFKVPHVVRRIAQLKQEIYAAESRAIERATERLAVTKEAVLAELAKIAFANMLDYGKPLPDGSFEVDLSKLDRDKAAPIREIIITEARGAGAGDKPKQRVRVRLAGKREALVDLGRHFGLFVDRRHAAPGTDEYADLTDEELAARIRDVVGELQRVGVDVATEFGIDAAAFGPRPPRPH